MASPEQCVPLCGASKAYGKHDRPWKHEPDCPVRLAWATSWLDRRKSRPENERG